MRDFDTPLIRRSVQSLIGRQLDGRERLLETLRGEARKFWRQRDVAARYDRAKFFGHTVAERLLAAEELHERFGTGFLLRADPGAR